MNSMELSDHSRLYILESLNTIFILVCKIIGNDGGAHSIGRKIRAAGSVQRYEYKEIFTNALLLLPNSAVYKHFVSGNPGRMAVRLFLNIISYFNNNWSVISMMLSSWYCYDCFILSFFLSFKPTDNRSMMVLIIFIFFLFFFFLENAFHELIQNKRRKK